MVLKWVRNVHDAIHRDGRKFVIINGKEHPVQLSLGKKLPYIKVGAFMFIKQNPNKTSEWALKAREGVRVTQVLRDNKYYGVIVGKKIFKYGEGGAFLIDKTH